VSQHFRSKHKIQSINYGIEFNDFMCNKLVGFVVLAVVMFSLIVALLHFWIFPNLIVVLQGFDFINVTDSFTNGLYWLLVGVFILISIRSSSV